MINLVKRKFKKLVESLLFRHGYQLVKHNQQKRLENLTFYILKNVSDTSQKIDSIVFSKDRAMQLNAFLVSYTNRTCNSGKMYILYKCSDGRHKKSYDELSKEFRNEKFVFIEEIDFRNQLLEILHNAEAGKVIFYVDDMIFTHDLDYNILARIDTNKYTLALSRGKDLDYSIVLQKALTQPAFTEIGNCLLQFNWDYYKELSDWTYPLGISGYMYGKIEILSICSAINFNTPNSLESAMQQYLFYFKNRLGLCPEFAVSVCIHANRVQNEYANPTLGTFSIEELLDLWESGKRIDVHEFYDKPINITQILKYRFIKCKITELK